MIISFFEKVLLAFTNVIGYIATLISNGNYIAIIAWFILLGVLNYIILRISKKHKNN